MGNKRGKARGWGDEGRIREEENDTILFFAMLLN